MRKTKDITNSLSIINTRIKRNLELQLQQLLLRELAEHWITKKTIYCEFNFRRETSIKRTGERLQYNDTDYRYPCYENPYPMDIDDSPVTSCLYFADCPPDLIPAYYSVGSKSKPKTGYSEKVGSGLSSTSCNITHVSWRHAGKKGTANAIVTHRGGTWMESGDGRSGYAK